MSVPREIELKLELDPSNARGFRRRAAALLGPAGGGMRQLASVYYDTRKLALHRRGFSLRVRTDGEHCVQTLKADGEAGSGFFDRPEWESAVPTGEPDPARFEDAAPARLLGKSGRLAPLFETRVERTTWTVEEGSSAIEVVVDEGTVSAGLATRRIAEVELELKRGFSADLFRLGRRLAESGRLRLGVRSKSERGYALIAGEAPAGVKAGQVALERGMNAGEAFQAVARSCIRHFRLNEAALIETRAVESLHQARVAMRRLRSALTLFSDVVEDDERERMKRELRAVSRVLGDARNLDVYRARMLEPGLAKIAGRIEADRERAYDRVVRRLGSKRFRLFMIDLAIWIEAGPWRSRDETAEAREQPAETFAADTLDRRWRKLRKKGRHLETLDPEARHRVRIGAKKLRYASEFFIGLIASGRAKRRRKTFVAALQELQSSLGDLNDIATGHEMAVGLASQAAASGGVGASTQLLAAAGQQDEREADLLASAAKSHRWLADAKPFWR